MERRSTARMRGNMTVNAGEFSTFLKELVNTGYIKISTGQMCIRDRNIALARQFLLENFVSRGMVVDFAVHQPDREDGGIPKPHFHVLCPIRPIEQNGKWGLKQRRVYELSLIHIYILMGLFSTNFGEAWRMAVGADASAKMLSFFSCLLYTSRCV